MNDELKEENEKLKHLIREVKAWVDHDYHAGRIPIQIHQERRRQIKEVL